MSTTSSCIGPFGTNLETAMTAVGEHTPLWRIVMRAVAQAPVTARRTLKWGLVVFVLMVLVQIWDVWGRSGPRVVAELLGSLAGFTGAWLVIFARVLHEISKSSGAAVRDGQPPLPPQVLMALPAVGFTGGALIAFGIANYLLRGVLGTSVWLVGLLSAVLLVMLILGARTVTDTTRFLYQFAQQQAHAAARAEAGAIEAQLATLQAQMHPHFLFNALNTVASLVRTDPRRAERTVESLADVLRRTLSHSRVPLHSLRDEIAIVEAYLAIEQERFGDRLRVEWSIASDTLDLQVPPLTLQPLVENALKHAIDVRLEGGRLRVTAARRDETLRLMVEDDGEGFSVDARDGVGLGNLRQRLATLFGDRAALRVESTAQGPRVVVDLPATASQHEGVPVSGEASAGRR